MATETTTATQTATEEVRQRPEVRTSPRRRLGSAATTIFAKILFDKRHNGKLLGTKAEDGTQATAFNNGAWVIGLAVLDRAPSIEEVRERIRTKIIDRFVRFNAVLRMNVWGASVFEELPADTPIDWEYHVPDLSEMSAGWTTEDVHKYLASLNNYKYDLDKPLWRYLILPNLADGTCALISCINHVIGDGLALVSVTECLYDPVEEDFKHGGKRPATGGKSKFDLLTRLGVFVHGLGQGALVPISTTDAPNPLRLPKGQMALGTKRLALAKPLSLERVKDIKNKMEGVTINDVLMGVMTLTLRRLFNEERTRSKNVTAQFPISMRRAGEGGLDPVFGEPHNNVSYAFFGFDLDLKDREESVWRCKQQIDLIKISPSPLMININTRIGSMLLPTGLMLDIANKVSNLGTAQLSNVPAPQKQVSMFNGCKVKDMNFFLFSPLACYFGILSYNGIVNAAFNLDSGLNVDPQRLANIWNDEFDALYAEIETKTKEGQQLVEPVQDVNYYRILGLGVVALGITLIARILLPYVFASLHTQL